MLIPIGFLPSGGEWFWIALLALVLFGPDKLPGIARTWGRWMGEFNRARSRIEDEIRAAAEEAEYTVRAQPAPHLASSTEKKILPDQPLEAPSIKSNTDISETSSSKEKI